MHYLCWFFFCLEESNDLLKIDPLGSQWSVYTIHSELFFVISLLYENLVGDESSGHFYESRRNTGREGKPERCFVREEEILEMQPERDNIFFEGRALFGCSKTSNLNRDTTSYGRRLLSLFLPPVVSMLSLAWYKEPNEYYIHVLFKTMVACSFQQKKLIELFSEVNIIRILLILNW